MTPRIIRAAFSLALWLPAAALSQGIRALVSGPVTGPYGPAVAGAAVTAIHLATGNRTTASTASDGKYVLCQSPPRQYQTTPLAMRSVGVAAEPSGFAWRREATSTALVTGGEIVWQFQHASTLPKPMFHPVSLPGGPVLSWDQPPDHRWHHAFWFAWKYINGLNYWEEGRTREPVGLTSWRNVKIATRPDYSASITLEVDYHPPDQPPVLKERREIQVSAPDAQGQYHFDWRSTFTAVVPVLLDRTPIPGEPSGASWGGYAGLSWRFAKDLTGWQVAFSDGDTALEPTGRRAAALEVNGTAAGVEAGVAFLDHSDNPNSPSPWHLVAQPRTSFLFAQPAVLYYGAHRLAANESLVLRYRVIVHPGRWSADRLKQESARFIREIRR